jgi:hypothetical protein
MSVDGGECNGAFGRNQRCFYLRRGPWNRHTQVSLCQRAECKDLTDIARPERETVFHDLDARVLPERHLRMSFLVNPLGIYTLEKACSVHSHDVSSYGTSSDRHAVMSVGTSSHNCMRTCARISQSMT